MITRNEFLITHTHKYMCTGVCVHVCVSRVVENVIELQFNNYRENTIVVWKEIICKCTHQLFTHLSLLYCYTCKYICIHVYYTYITIYSTMV